MVFSTLKAATAVAMAATDRLLKLGSGAALRASIPCHVVSEHQAAVADTRLDRLRLRAAQRAGRLIGLAAADGEFIAAQPLLLGLEREQADARGIAADRGGLADPGAGAVGLQVAQLGLPLVNALLAVVDAAVVLRDGGVVGSHRRMLEQPAKAKADNVEPKSARSGAADLNDIGPSCSRIASVALDARHGIDVADWPHSRHPGRPHRSQPSIRQASTRKEFPMAHAIRIQAHGGPEVMKYEEVQVPAARCRSSQTQTACDWCKFH